MDEKRRRYPPSGGELIPLVFETGGRPCDEAAALVRNYGHGLDAVERTSVLANVWRRISRTLQTGNADVVITATA